MKKSLIIYNIPGNIKDFVDKLEKIDFLIVGLSSVSVGGIASITDTSLENSRLVGKLKKFDSKYQLHILAGREESKRLIYLADDYNVG